MRRLIQFEPEHLEAFANFGGQEDRAIEVGIAGAAELRNAKGECFTAIRDNVILCCAGVIEANRYRATAWAFFQKTTHADFLYVHRQTSAFLSNTGYLRIEAYVDPLFVAALKWIRMLGFHLEKAYLPYFFPDGSPASSWAINK